ncbi:MAG: DUF3368 domain-containing protein [Actinomycetota bacterium]
MHIPEIVWKELVIDGKDRKETELIKKSGFLKIHRIKDLNLYKLLRKDLDEGEAGAICLSLELKSGLILLDESEARRIADIYGLEKTGILGILLKAKKDKIISSLREEIQKLKRDAGFFISKELEEPLLKDADE